MGQVPLITLKVRRYRQAGNSLNNVQLATFGLAIHLQLLWKTLVQDQNKNSSSKICQKEPEEDGGELTASVQALGLRGCSTWGTSPLSTASYWVDLSTSFAFSSTFKYYAFQASITQFLLLIAVEDSAGYSWSSAITNLTTRRSLKWNCSQGSLTYWSNLQGPNTLRPMSPEPKGSGFSISGYSQSHQAPASVFMHVGGQGESWVLWPWSSSHWDQLDLSRESVVLLWNRVHVPLWTSDFSLLTQKHCLLYHLYDCMFSLPCPASPVETMANLPHWAQTVISLSLNHTETSDKALQVKGLVREPKLTHLM